MGTGLRDFKPEIRTINEEEEEGFMTRRKSSENSATALIEAAAGQQLLAEDLSDESEEQEESPQRDQFTGQLRLTDEEEATVTPFSDGLEELVMKKKGPVRRHTVDPNNDESLAVD